MVKLWPFLVTYQGPFSHPPHFRKLPGRALNNLTKFCRYRMNGLRQHVEGQTDIDLH